MEQRKNVESAGVRNSTGKISCETDIVSLEELQKDYHARLQKEKIIEIKRELDKLDECRRYDRKDERSNGYQDRWN